MNLIVRWEFDLAYFEAAVKHVSQYTTENLPSDIGIKYPRRVDILYNQPTNQPTDPLYFAYSFCVPFILFLL